MHRVTMFVVAVALMGCGGGPSSDFEGTWRGTTTFCDQGTTSCHSRTGTVLRLTVEDDVVRVTGFCPDGTGEMLVIGEGERLEWEGDVRCAWPPGPLCSTSTVRYTRAVATIRGGEMKLDAVGVVAGCGYVVPIDTTFAGRK
jgi:hypothetical protein